jgi:drug/metabolite transporter (DMT)-like permease
MSINKALLDKGIKFLLYALPLMFIGPSVIYNAFINKQNVWHWLVLAVGIFLSGLAVYFMFKGIKILTDALFENEK